MDVTCETAPHYLLLTDGDLQDDGRFKMNPPIRSAADRDALIEGLLDGTIDMIATDHAPHTAAEKAGGLKNSANGRRRAGIRLRGAVHRAGETRASCRLKRCCA